MQRARRYTCAPRTSSTPPSRGSCSPTSGSANHEFAWFAAAGALRRGVVTTAALLDLISLVRRELGVDDVRVVERGAPSRVAAHRTIARCDLPDGRMLVARFDEAPHDVEAL